MGKYDDIINLPHHVSDFHKPMPMSHRAAQFAPFAALSGHDDAISETARVTEEFKELSEEEKNILSGKLKYAIENQSYVVVKHFVADKIKSGGANLTVRGKIKKWDEYGNVILIDDGSRIPIHTITELNNLTSSS